MKPDISSALEAWRTAYQTLQDAAVTVLCLALPGLGRSATPTYCCPVTLHIGKPGSLGEGRICVDDDGRATIEITDIPVPVLAEAADTVFGIGWFDEADGPLADEEPGEFHYDDENTGAEWILELGADGMGKVLIECVAVPDAAELLAAITTAHLDLLDTEPASAPGEAGTLTA